MNLIICNGGRGKYLVYLFFLLFYFWSNHAFSQVPFECNGSAYLVSATAGAPSSTMQIVDATNPNTILATLNPSIQDRYNGIGYNFEDNFIYGMVQGTDPSLDAADIVQIDAEGTVTRKGVPTPIAGQVTGLPVWAGASTDTQRVIYAAGVVGLDNKLYTFSMDTNTGARYIVTVDLTDMEYSTRRLQLDNTQNDIAFSSLTGLLYGVSGSTIVSTDPTNGNQQIISLAPGSAPPPPEAGGAWNDVQGRVYFYANGATPPNRLYRFDPQTNLLTDITAATTYGTFDATACFPTTLEKEIIQPPEGFVPGDVVEVEFSIYNGQALTQTYQFEDVLQSTDLSWNPTSVTPASPGGGTVTFTGQTLTITDIVVDPIASTGNLPLTFTVSYTIDPTASRMACYSNQASITTGGITVLSDDPSTAEPVDPTDYCLSICDVPAPTGGGNQYQCAEAGSIPTLVATATVEPGHTLTWYDAPIGGNPVIDPSLDTVGEITYYAQASFEGCNSSRTPVFLKIESPQIDNPGDEVHCESYTFPPITGVGLSGNEAYYSAPNGGGTQYLPGDTITDVGDHTFYIYDEIQARDNCEGTLNVVPNTEYVLDDLYGSGSHFRYSGAVDPEFWNGNSDQQILSDVPGAPVGDQIYIGIIGEVSLGDTSACFGDQVNISAQVDVTNQGPTTGMGYSGSFSIINTNTNQRIYTTSLDYNYPVGVNSIIEVSGVVPVSEVDAGNIAILIVVETVHGGDKDWLLSSFNAEFQFFPANIPSCSGEEEFSVNILGLPDAGIIDENQTLCYGDTAETINSTTDGSGGGTISYRWESSTTDASSGFSPIAGETGPTLSPGALTQTTFYRRITVNNESGITCESLPTGVITLTVNQELEAGTIGADQTLCYGETPSMITSITDGSGGGTISYRWESSTTDASTGFSTIAGETGPTLSPGALTQTTFYRRITVSNENGIDCESIPTDAITITVNQEAGAGAIGADQTLCYGETPSMITSTTDGSGGGTISYRWESSTTDASSGFSTIAGETGPTLSPGALTQTTYYRRVTLTNENGIDCESIPSGAITITVNQELEAGTIGADQTLCYGETPSMITSITDGSGGGTISYRWESSTTDASSGFNPIAGETGSTLSPGALTQTTYYRRVTLTNENGITCESIPSGAITITVNQEAGAGDIGTDQTICFGETPSMITSITDGSGGGTISYRWESSTTDASTGFSTIVGEIGSTLSPGALTQTTYYRRVTVTNENGITCESLPTGVITLTVNQELEAGTIGADQTVCFGETPSMITSTTDGSGGGTISYRWESSTTDASTGFSTIAGETGSTLSPGALTQTTYYRRVTVSNENGIDCESTPTAAVAITVNQEAGAGAIGTDQTVCFGETPSMITSTTDGSGGGTISYRWESSTTDASTGFSPIAGETGSTLSPGALTQTTFYRRISVTNENGITCESLPTNVITINVIPIPTGYDDSINGLDCSGNFSYNLQDNINDTANGGNGISANFTWVPQPNSSIVGASSGTGPLINQSLQNLSNTEQTVIYTVTAGSASDVSCSSTFDVAVIVPVCSSMSLTKVSDVSSVNLAGDVVNYTFTLTNTSNANQTNIVLSDPLIGGTISGPDSGDVNSNSVLEAGEVWQYNASYTVLQQDIDNNGNPTLDSGILQNSATATSAEIPAGVTATSDVLIERNPSSTIEKIQSSGPRPVTTAGEVLGYTITVTNTGNVSLSDVVIDDTLPDGSTGTVVLTGGDVDADAEVDPGEQWIYSGTYTVTQSDIDAGEDLVNSAVLTTDLTNTPQKDTVGIPIVQLSDIITQKKTRNNDLVGYIPGGSVEYVIEVHNNGPSAAQNVHIADTAPVGTSIRSWTAEVVEGIVTLPNTSGVGNLDQTLTVLPNQATVRYMLIVDIPIEFEEELVNAVTVTTTTEDPDPECVDCITIPLEPIKVADIVTTKTVHDDFSQGYVAGTPVIYQIEVTNMGPNSADDVNVVDIAPEGTTITSWTAEVTQGNITIPSTSGTGDLDEIIPDFPNQATVVYTITLDVPEDFTSDLTNVVEVFSPTEDPDPTCPDCEVTIPELRTEISLIKTATLDDTNANGLADAGESILYSFSVTNTGNTIVTDITIVDEMIGLQLSGEPFDLEPGQTNNTAYRAEYVIRDSDIVKGSVSNQAVAQGVDSFQNRIEDYSDHSNLDGDNPTEIEIKRDCNLEVFNAVTPNADGVNDFFKIAGIECYPENTLEIFNRWGILVFKSKNYDNRSNVFSGYSDGRSTINREELLPTGTYFYVLQYRTEQGNTDSKSGYLYLNQ